MNDRLNALDKYRYECEVETSSDCDDDGGTTTCFLSRLRHKKVAEDEEEPPTVENEPVDQLEQLSQQLVEQCDCIEHNVNALQQAYAAERSRGVDVGERAAQIAALQRDTVARASSVRAALRAQRRGGSDAVGRMQDNVTAAISARFLALLARHQQLQSEHRAARRQDVMRSAAVACPTLTADQLEELLDGGSEVQALVQRSLLCSDHSRQVQSLVALSERHADILRLEADICQLHEIFVDCAALVDAQDHMIAQIGYNVEQAEAYTGAAVRQLRQARKYTSSVRKKKCLVCAAMGGVAVTIMGGIALGVAPLTAACTIC